MIVIASSACSYAVFSGSGVSIITASSSVGSFVIVSSGSPCVSIPPVSC